MNSNSKKELVEFLVISFGLTFVLLGCILLFGL